MTKDQEKAALRTFIASLPFDSYLYSILSTVQLHINDQIDNDFNFVDWSIIQQEQLQHVQAARKAREELQLIRDQKQALARDMDKMEASIRTIQTEANRIIGIR